MGEETIRDFLWTDIFIASPEHMKVALQTRRRQVLGDVKQMKTDCDSYDDSNTHGANVQFSIDFTKDVQEMDLPTEYPDAPQENAPGE